MSYSKQTWVNGEVITAEKLNHMEDGIEGAGGGGSSALVVNVTQDNPNKFTMDKTWDEIKSAGGNILIQMLFEDELGVYNAYFPLLLVSSSGTQDPDNPYEVKVFTELGNAPQFWTFTAPTSTDQLSMIDIS